MIEESDEQDSDEEVKGLAEENESLKEKISTQVAIFEQYVKVARL